MSVSECFFAFALLARLEERGVPMPDDPPESVLFATENTGKFIGATRSPANQAAYDAKSEQIMRHDDAPTEALLALLRENREATRLAKPGHDLQNVPAEMLDSNMHNGRLSPAHFDPLTGRAGWFRMPPPSGATMEGLRDGILQVNHLSRSLVLSDRFEMVKDHWLVFGCGCLAKSRFRGNNR